MLLGWSLALHGGGKRGFGETVTNTDSDTGDAIFIRVKQLVSYTRR